MKKRILSILLCLVMVMGLLPMQAVAEEGQECANCSHIHWGDAVCESCGECFENGADRCPIHEDEPHCAECAGFVCEECQRCEYVDDISECRECGLCAECCQEKSLDEGCSTGEVCIESLEWSTHICEDCGTCFCETDKCDTCNRCTDCCLTKGDCTDCDCGKAESHTHHKFNAKDWHVDETYHWHECRVCGDPVDKAPHNRTAAGRCEICGYDPENPVFFAVQPRSITKKVSYDDAEETDPNSPYVNRGKFSGTAVNLAGEELSFQWYEVLTKKRPAWNTPPGSWWTGSTMPRALPPTSWTSAFPLTAAPISMSTTAWPRRW